MSMSVFHQSKHYVNWKTFTLTPTGVNVQQQKFVVRATFNVPFESIPNESIEVSIRSDYPLRLLVVSAGIGLLIFIGAIMTGTVNASVFWLLIAPIFFGSQFYYSKATFLVFQCADQVLEFYRDRPSPEEVQKFIQAMQFQKQQYLTAKYSPIAGGDLVESIRRLTWLKESGSVTDEEFEKLKAELLKNLQNPRGRIDSAN